MRPLPFLRPKPIFSDETARLLQEFNLHAFASGYEARVTRPHGYPSRYLCLSTNAGERIVTDDEGHIQAILRRCVQQAKDRRSLRPEEHLRLIERREEAKRTLMELEPLAFVDPRKA